MLVCTIVHVSCKYTHAHTHTHTHTHMQGVAERDRLVFSEVRKRGIPIFMVTSGGYQVHMTTTIAIVGGVEGMAGYCH